MKKKIKTEEILSSIIQTNFVKSSKKEFFPKTKKEFFKLKTELGKALKLEGNYEFENIYIPVNEILSLLNQRDYWTKEELRLLDEQMKEYSLKYLVKLVANMI